MSSKYCSNTSAYCEETVLRMPGCKLSPRHLATLLAHLSPICPDLKLNMAKIMTRHTFLVVFGGISNS